jgi:hypothetical protein
MDKKDKILLGSIALLFVTWLIIILAIVFSTRKVENITSEDNSNTRRWTEDSINIVRVNSINDLTLKELSKLKTQDSLIKELINTVNQFKKELKKGGSVTNFTTTNIINDTIASYITKVEYETVSDTVFVYPTYEGKLNTLWYSGLIRASRETLILDSLKVYGDYSIIQGTEKYGFLKLKQKQFVQVNSNNPYARVDKIKTYIVPKKTKKIVVGLGVFGGMGLNNDGSFDLNPDFGFGLFLGYKLFEL